MTEFERMTKGLVSNNDTPQHESQYDLCRSLMAEINTTGLTNLEIRNTAFKKLFGTFASDAYIEAPFYCDYGCNIHMGHSFINFGCTILDVGIVTIGNDVMIGPNVQIYTVRHPLKLRERLTSLNDGLPITIMDGAWIGGGAIILPGVTIGKGAVVGAGSVVTKDVADFTVVGGNPAKKIRDIEPQEIPEIRCYCGSDKELLAPLNSMIRESRYSAIPDFTENELLQFLFSFSNEEKMTGVIRCQEFDKVAFVDLIIADESTSSEDNIRIKAGLIDEIAIRQRLRGTTDLYVSCLSDDLQIILDAGFSHASLIPETISEIITSEFVLHKEIN